MAKRKRLTKFDINAIIIAVITLAGTLGAAYFISRGNTRPTEMIISATETAQARETFTIEHLSTFTPVPLKPEIILKGTEEFENNGETWTRYYLEIKNWQDFPSNLFEASPNLPPCGLNNNSSRSWVGIYDGDYNDVLINYCAISSPLDLQSLWFPVKKNSDPPITVYIVINDRLENKFYVSNEIVIR